MSISFILCDADASFAVASMFHIDKVICLIFLTGAYEAINNLCPFHADSSGRTDSQAFATADTVFIVNPDIGGLLSAIHRMSTKYYSVFIFIKM
jgi:hypothetical protein